MNTLQGLTDQEIQKRIEANQKEEAYQTMTNSIGTIIKKNVCTLFNFLNFMIALCLFLVHALLKDPEGNKEMLAPHKVDTSGYEKNCL